MEIAIMAGLFAKGDVDVQAPPAPEGGAFIGFIYRFLFKNQLFLEYKNYFFLRKSTLCTPPLGVGGPFCLTKAAQPV